MDELLAVPDAWDEADVDGGADIAYALDKDTEAAFDLHRRLALSGITVCPLFPRHAHTHINTVYAPSRIIIFFRASSRIIIFSSSSLFPCCVLCVASCHE